MKGIKNSFFYISTIGVFSLLMYWIVIEGGKLEDAGAIPSPVEKSQWDHFIETLLENIKHPLAILLAQIITIIIAARIFGWVFKKIGQPTVIGEIIAGIVLGPSVIGMYFP